jgi:hypothetical protein
LEVITNEGKGNLSYTVDQLIQEFDDKIDGVHGKFTVLPLGAKRQYSLCNEISFPAKKTHDKFVIKNHLEKD